MAVPRHVSIIMDGNGRWAKARGKERIFGHYEGVKSVHYVTEAAVEDGIEYLSLYTFSEENWNRPLPEVKGLMKLTMKAVKDEIQTIIDNNVRFIVLGNRERLGKDVNEALSEIERKTASNTGTRLIIFMSYSGKWDLMQAMKKARAELSPEEFQAMEPADFDKYLVTAGIPDPDLIIRTSGEQRISNYLLWQGAYSEYYFTDVLWPDFRKDEFRAAIKEYEGRDRRYGKVK